MRRPVYSHHLKNVESLRAYDLEGALAALEQDPAFPAELTYYEAGNPGPDPLAPRADRAND